MLLLYLLDLLLNFLLDAGRLESGRHFLVLQTNDADDLANIALNGKELVHVAKLQALLLGELARVAEALEEDESLIGARLGNLLLEESHDEWEVEVRGRELLFLERIVCRTLAEVELLLAS